VVYLVDHDAVVLWSTGSSPALVEEASASPGSKWSEGFVGTNAAGSAVATDEPVFALGFDQGEPPWRRYSAVAVPLHGREGEVLGAVVASAPVGGGQRERLALAAYAAYAAEWRIGEGDEPVSSMSYILAGKRARQEEASKFRRLLDSAPDASVIVDENGAILFASARCERLLGYSQRELLGRPVDFIIPEEIREFQEGLHRAFTDSDPPASGIAMELHVRRVDGKEIPVEISLSPVRMREGHLLSLAFRDVTVRRDVVRRLEVQFAVSRALAEGEDLGGTILRVLEVAAKRLGWDFGGVWLSEAEGKEPTAGRVSACTALAGTALASDLQAFALKEGGSLARRIWKEATPILSASTFPEGNASGGAGVIPRPSVLSCYGIPIQQAARRIGVLIFFNRGDIQVDKETQKLLSYLGSQLGQFVERWKISEHLRSSEAQLQLLLRQMPLAVWTVDVNLVIVYCAGTLYGRNGLERPEAYLGMALGSLFPGEHLALAVHRDAVSGKSGRFELERGEKAYACYVEPLRDRQGEIVGALGAAIDITGLKRAQESDRRLTVELERQVGERSGELQTALREINALSYTIAHDLRAPLRAIASGAQIILEDETRLGDEARQWAHRIGAAASRMDALVLGLLEYSRLARQDLVIQTVDMEAVVREVLSQMDHQISEAQATIVVDRPLLPIRGHPLALVQAVGNLLSNAIKFVAPNVHPWVRIRSERVGSRGGIPIERIWVEDNGIGIAAEHRDRIFGVFEKLHGGETYPGTGIGLAITKRVVERMGGRIGVESELGRGSNFYVELPVA
jgi:PAS domain S-box-containing protein